MRTLTVPRRICSTSPACTLLGRCSFCLALVVFVFQSCFRESYESCIHPQSSVLGVSTPRLAMRHVGLCVAVPPWVARPALVCIFCLCLSLVLARTCTAAPHSYAHSRTHHSLTLAQSHGSTCFILLPWLASGTYSHLSASAASGMRSRVYGSQPCAALGSARLASSVAMQPRRGNASSYRTRSLDHLRRLVSLTDTPMLLDCYRTPHFFEPSDCTMRVAGAPWSGCRSASWSRFRLVSLCDGCVNTILPVWLRLPVVSCLCGGTVQTYLCGHFYLCGHDSLL